ncbi:unnamed protein product [Cyclocybe aegerita]|uniref:Uncharacterized protein n=1 Tax=Cyclocybe aegerita TaxID=1973307 RepID=A0A8S0WJ59_CYCAE|nr:unnamed protein product [Cyclocybe aegerita]
MTEKGKHIGWFWIPAELFDMEKAYVGGHRSNYLTGSTANLLKDTDTVCLYSISLETTLAIFYTQNSRFCSDSWPVQRDTARDEDLINPARLKPSMHSFQDLLECDLHIPYHFVIANIGQKLYQLYGTGAIDFERDFPSLWKEYDGNHGDGASHLPGMDERAARPGMARWGRDGG